MDRVEMHNDARELAHGILRFRVHPPGGRSLEVLGTHLDAHDESKRLRDTAYLNRLLDPTRFQTDDYCLAGDLNSMSPRDPYPADLAALLEASGTTKYGLPPRFDVVRLLESYGWMDALYHGQTPDAWITARRDRGGVHIDYRTDYVWLSPSLATRLRGARVVAVGDASDHDAVVADFVPDAS
jgi:exodeoxyribonuclease-3